MEQNSLFQNSFDMDYFSNRFLPSSLPFADSFDAQGRRGSISFFDAAAFGFKPTHQDNHDSNHHEGASLYNDENGLKVPQVQNFLDSGLENYFGMKDKEFGYDAFQIVRSRGGSFNFGSFRKESEDLFHMNSDIFKHIRNITDSKNPLENIFAKPVHQAPVFDINHHNDFAVQNKINQSVQLREIASNIHEKTTTCPSQPSQPNSAVINPMDDSAAQGAKKRGRKKRVLNDGTEVVVEEENVTKKNKPGRPPKNNNVKNEAEFGGMIVKREISMIDDKATEMSSNTSKGGNSPITGKSKTDIMSDLVRMNAPQNIKELLNQANMPSDVKEFIKNSNLMDKKEWLDNRRIGTLTIAERRAKIEKYLAKRRLRTSSRKVNYDCRKRVADSRLRIKGRFVTRPQAFEMLNVANIPYNPESITNLEIKALLTEANVTLPVIKKILAESGSDNKRPAEEDFNGFTGYNYGEYEA